MMGQHDRSEALFYYFRLEDQVPESLVRGQFACGILFRVVPRYSVARWAASNCASSEKPGWSRGPIT